MKQYNDEKEEIISELKKAANQLKEITEIHRKRRPIVIEFSGSPKSGKTSCINSLKQFLKRNGFVVEVIQERASICPVFDKHSPMFNIWTACSSISGLIGVLESKKNICDVLILDRGIFDALCWFEWLENQDKIESTLRSTIDNFLLIQEFVNKIDIVFAFTSTPQRSIEREYASLLTDELGSIMNETVLQQYLEAIEITTEEKGKYFRNIESINTTDEDQNQVSKTVTIKTLEILKDLFMEHIAYVGKEELVFPVDENYSTYKFKRELFNQIIKFDLRDLVEKKDDFLQPIPIGVITNKTRDRVLVLKKNNKSISKSSPERDVGLLYAGGHIRKEDRHMGYDEDFVSICRTALKREIDEELGINVSLEKIKPDIIYTPQFSSISKRHIAICFLIEVDIEVIKLTLDPHELTQTRGTSKSGKFYPIKDFSRLDINFESWSRYILKKYFNFEIDDSNQMTIFDYLELEEKGNIE